MNDNPYNAPAAAVRDAAPRVLPAVPDEVMKKIKAAWIAAVCSGTITLIVVVIAMVTGKKVMDLGLWNLVDVILIFGLAFGIYKKSRTCAVIMLVYFAASKIFQVVETGQANGLVMGILFTILFVQGVIGTFQYHRILSRA
jgi:hypothetical protein